MPGEDGAQALPALVQDLLVPGELGSEAPPELVQTHASYVLLTPDRVYKLKKPRDLGFLDYSTLDLRRRACEAEVTLNRRLTSGVYLGVEPISLSDDRAVLGGSGEPVEYAVVMRRLPEDRMMNRLVEHDGVTEEMLESLARRLAAFYARAATGGAIDAAASAGSLLYNWQENFIQTLPQVGATLDAGQYLQIVEAVYAELLRLRPIWRERITAGRARDCHGDLRLSAVCFAEQIQVYDCIEFSERLRFGDVAADIAFLAMDLDEQGRPDLADEFVARFVAASGDTTLPAVMPFYACYRAYVRGKVDGMLLEEAEVSEPQRQSARAAALRRYAAAAAYAQRPAMRTVVVAGPDARLTRLLGAALAARVGAVLLATDDGNWQEDAERYRALDIAVVAIAPAAELDRVRSTLSAGSGPSLAITIGASGGLNGAVEIKLDSPRHMIQEMRRRLESLAAGDRYPPGKT